MDLIFLLEQTAHSSWKPLIDQFKQTRQQEFEKIEAKMNKVPGLEEFIYPRREDVFRVFKMDLNDIRVLVSGQDCYHNIENNVPQAVGLAFSVPRTHAIPSSLFNIYKQCQKDFGWETLPTHGDLTSWFNQGVFLLNAALTVFHKKPGIYLSVWKPITDDIIRFVDKQLNGKLVVMLWGSFALGKKELFQHTPDDHILVSSHPSGLSCHKGLQGYPAFCDNKHFAKCNELLKQMGKEPIDWYPNLKI